MGGDRGKKSTGASSSSSSRDRSRSPVRSGSGSLGAGSSGSGSSGSNHSPSPGSSSILPPPPPAENLTRSDFLSLMSEAMNAQFPKLILETTKVVTAQLQSENLDSTRSFTSYSQDLKQLKLRTEEVEAKAKTAALKSEGGY